MRPRNNENSFSGDSKYIKLNLNIMEYKIITNLGRTNLKKHIEKFGKKADKIKIASAFFSKNDFIIDWLDSGKKLELLLSLRPPTNYYLLNEIYQRKKINIYNIGKEFHSKFYIFFKKEKPIGCVLGSSNFTNGGLVNNIETNIVTADEKFLEVLLKHYGNIKKDIKKLSIDELNDYKPIYDKFKSRIKEIEEDEKNFYDKYIKSRNKPKSNEEKISDYIAYCELINKINSYVKDISDKEFPGIPTNIAIDHFWHWVKEMWALKKEKIRDSENDKIDDTRRLFKEYCKWDKENNNDTEKIYEKQKNIFSTLLSLNNIDKLTEQDIVKIYISTNAGDDRVNQRKRITEDKLYNDISVEKARKSLKYLLYSEDKITDRINNLLNTKSEYKLKHFGPSIIQELIGWVNPDKYPLRNDKADKAIKLLGFEL